MSPLLWAVVPFAVAAVGLWVYGSRQIRTHAAMRGPDERNTR